MEQEKDKSVDEKDVIESNKMLQVLDGLYDKVLNGVPKVSKPVDQLADDYLRRHKNAEEAAKSLIRYQIAKCGTSGFITGLGGMITLPVSVPANITSVLYVQLRMVATIAKMGGYDVNSDQVQTLIYSCLAGSAMADVLKSGGITIGEKMVVAQIKRIPGEVLKKINQKVGFRLVTKFGEKGAINLVKLVPVVGGVIGGTVDVSSTKIIANNAYRLFIKGNHSQEKDYEDVDALDVEFDEIVENDIQYFD